MTVIHHGTAQRWHDGPNSVSDCLDASSPTEGEKLILALNKGALVFASSQLPVECHSGTSVCRPQGATVERLSELFFSRDPFRIMTRITAVSILSKIALQRFVPGGMGLRGQSGFPVRFPRLLQAEVVEVSPQQDTSPQLLPTSGLFPLVVV